MTTASIWTWVEMYTEQDTLKILRRGENIYFQKENLCTNDVMVPTVIRAAYMYKSIEEDRKKDLKRMEYLRMIEEGRYRPGRHLGYELGTFVPSGDAEVIRNVFQKAADGEELWEIAMWMNRNGYRTDNGHFHTLRSIEALLTNAVYIGEVVFKKVGLRVKEHHEPLVSRELWEKVGSRLKDERRTMRYLKIAL